MGKLDGKVALVGGSLGKIKKDNFSANLGTEIAKQLQAEGAQVILIDIDDEVAKKCAEAIGGNAKAMECDIVKVRTAVDPRAKEIEWTDNPALDVVNKIAADYGKLDIVIAAFDDFGKQKKMVKMSGADFDALRDGNLTANFHLLAAVREQLKAQKAADGTLAKVVIVTSMAGKAGLGMATVYSGMKAGLIGLTKNLAREFGRFANTNAVAVGPVKDRRTFGPPDKVKAKFMVTKTDMANQPITFEKVAPLVVFLASDDAVAINGQIISVDGGLWLKVEI